MKRIVIIGDSWGIEPTTMYVNPQISQRHNSRGNTSVFDWIDYKLMSLGHSVSNRSWGGCNNYYLLTIVETMLDAAKHNNFNVDLVIWFHGELTKEIWWGTQNLENPIDFLKTIQQQGFEVGIDEIAQETYKYAKQIAQNHPNTKWAIIGAGAALRKSKIHLLDFADLLVENLRSDIVGRTTPECQTYYCIKDNNIIDELVERKIFTEQEKEIEVQKWEYLDRIQSDTNYFYNTKHPSPLAYKNLTDQIIIHFSL